MLAAAAAAGVDAHGDGELGSSLRFARVPHADGAAERDDAARKAVQKSGATRSRLILTERGAKLWLRGGEIDVEVLFVEMECAKRRVWTGWRELSGGRWGVMGSVEF